HVTAVLGAVIRKGPAALTTVTVMVSEAIPPPLARLSRAVSLKSMLRSVVGSDSPRVVVLLRISLSLGRIRLGLLVGGNERKIGRLPLSVLGGAGAPRSNSSQSYVNVLVGTSVAEPLSSKGVWAGMV